jgi:zinc protease
VGSAFNPTKQPGSFKVAMQTKSSSAPEAIAKTREEIEHIRNEPVSDQELSEAKQYLTGSFPTRFDSDGKIAGLLSQIEFYGLGDDFTDKFVERTNAVTAADVQRVAQQYLHPDELVLVVVGPGQDANAKP